MSFQVTGADGRMIVKNAGEGEAWRVATDVHANTGETVAITRVADGWTRHVSASDDTGETTGDLRDLTAKQLLEVARERGVEGVTSKTKKDDLIAALEA